MKIDVLKYQLDFRFEAGTSRGVLSKKDSYFIKISHEENQDVFGIGECGPLPGLSPDLEADLSKVLDHCREAISGLEEIGKEQLKAMIPGNYPAVLFGIETALMDLLNGGKRIIYNNQFVNGHLKIPINGLVWMGNRDEMLKRIHEKLQEGFRCIKIKIGAINFKDEVDLIKQIREAFPVDEVTIRLDANGAFSPNGAIVHMDKLEKYDIHSIEQPIKAGDWKAMQEVCRYSPIPVALDEELIGLHNSDYKAELLDAINPQYIVIKPSLVGGLRETEEWIQLASQRAVGWWLTSALESNIGLNAIAQFTANQKLELPQGLGTGQLFNNNIPSPLDIEDANLIYNPKASWDFAYIGFDM